MLTAENLPLCTTHISHVDQCPDVQIALFTNVSNASYLRQQLLDGNTAFEYAFIDAKMIVSPAHLLAAIQRALRDASHARLRTRNVHSEIVFCLSAANNIADAFRKFGISDNTTSLIAVKASSHSNADAVAAHLATNVQGHAVMFGYDTLTSSTDWAAVKRVYKLGKEKSGSVLSATDAEAAILGMIALRGS